MTYQEACDPIGFHETVVETHVTVEETGRKRAFLFGCDGRPQFGAPKEVGEFLGKHERNLTELAVVYDGSKTEFPRIRGGKAAYTHYYRDHAEYHLKVWDHPPAKSSQEPKLIFDKKFRAVPSAW